MLTRRPATAQHSQGAPVNQRSIRDTALRWPLAQHRHRQRSHEVCWLQARKTRGRVSEGESSGFRLSTQERVVKGEGLGFGALLAARLVVQRGVRGAALPRPLAQLRLR